MTTLVITKHRLAHLADGYDLRAWHVTSWFRVRALVVVQLPLD
jgi:hypothetical protein